MIELRWVEFGNTGLGPGQGYRQLEYRTYILDVDASGEFCPSGEWTDWKVVPTIDGDEAAVEDLIASGGIADAP